MSHRSHYPPGVPCWVDTLQPDVDAAMHFYGALFGWSFSGAGPLASDSAGRYHVARLHGRDVAGIGTRPDGMAAGSPSWDTHIAVERVTEAVRRVSGAGGTILLEPFDVLPAGRMAVVADPEGARFCLWEAGTRQGAGIVNEAGAWTMSQLHVRDPGAVAPFYDALFGRKTDTFEFGDLAMMLLRLPGYVGGEPEQPVPRDVVAVMSPLKGNGDERAHWSVGFWVADAGATASRAVALGGRVLAGPFESPAGPSAVLEGPAGAAFGVTTAPGPRA